jgi:hypothetical protein
MYSVPPVRVEISLGWQWQRDVYDMTEQVRCHLEEVSLGCVGRERSALTLTGGAGDPHQGRQSQFMLTQPRLR